MGKRVLDDISKHGPPSEALSSRALAHGSVFAGYLCLPNLDRPPPIARHQHAVVLYYTRGEARMEQRGRFEVNAGDLLVIPAGEAHRLLAAHRLEGWALGVQPTCLARVERGALLDPFDRVRRGAVATATVSHARRPYLETLLGELGEVTAHESFHAEETIDALLTLILREVRRAQADSPSLPPSLVSDTLAYIEQHCTEGISLHDVALAMRRSPAYLTTATRQATGRTVGAWITVGRMAEARRRLLHSEECIDRIGERVGYVDPTHFIRTFRKAHGQTPAAWRRLHRGALSV